MNKLGLAFKAFLSVLRNGIPAGVPAPVTPQESKPVRSDALTLLATLQREARLVDFLMEPLDGCSDQQIGAAVRDIQKDSRAVLARLFDLKPLRSEVEGSKISVPAGFDSAEFKLTGNVSGSAPYQGELMHSGWKAGKTEIPLWNGSAAASSIVAPAEIEIR